MRTRIAATGLSVLFSMVLAGCSGEPTASAAGASSGATPTAANSAPIAGSQVGASQSGGNASIDPAEYVRRCKDETQPSVDCEALRSRVVADILVDLRNLQNSKDKRGAKQALAALEFEDEPEIIIGACRILGRFPETPGLAEKILPFLDSKFIYVQSMASTVLMGNANPELQDLGRMWTDNHRSLHVDDAYDEYPDFPEHLAAMGFPKYPGAEWFSPADSDRSIGWSTPDDVDKVAKWLGDTLHAEIMTPQKWSDVVLEQSQLPLKDLIDPARTARMQQLMERLMKGDQTAQAELDKMQKDIDEVGKRAGEAGEKSIVAASEAPSSMAAGGRWIVAKKKGERISQLILVFPVPALKRTGVKYMWDLTDYPTAWPVER